MARRGVGGMAMVGEMNDGGAFVLDAYRKAMRKKGYALRRETLNLYWAQRFLMFHAGRHPRQLSSGDVDAFLFDLASRRNSTLLTHATARDAIVNLYEMLGDRLDCSLFDFVGDGAFTRPRILSRDDVARILSQLVGVDRSVCGLVYGSGLRLLEVLRLRIRDLDFVGRRIAVRDGRGGQHRQTIMPNCLVGMLMDQLAFVRGIHRQDVRMGHGEAYLPFARSRRYSFFLNGWSSQYVFPAVELTRDSSKGVIRRRHMACSDVRQALTRAARQAGVCEAVSPSVLRHSFAAHIIAAGCDIKTVQTLLGHASVTMTMMYVGLADRCSDAIRSPLDVCMSRASWPVSGNAGEGTGC